MLNKFKKSTVQVVHCARSLKGSEAGCRRPHPLNAALCELTWGASTLALVATSTHLC